MTFNFKNCNDNRSERLLLCSAVVCAKLIKKITFERGEVQCQLSLQYVRLYCVPHNTDERCAPIHIAWASVMLAKGALEKCKL